MSDSSEFTGGVSRRSILSLGMAGAAGLALAGCSTYRAPARVSRLPEPIAPPVIAFAPNAQMYGAMQDDVHAIPAVPVDEMDPRYLRQIVRDPTGEMPGTIVVDTGAHFLYLVQPGGEAMRYGVGLGRQGFEWAGRGVIEWKQHWPRWFPPEEMIARDPKLEKYRAIQIPGTNEWEGGMPAGIENPLGARAMYIYQDGKDTLYRVHGSPEWWSIGKSVSSGCVRLINQDIIDLYDRVAEGSPLVVGSGYGVS